MSADVASTLPGVEVSFTRNNEKNYRGYQWIVRAKGVATPVRVRSIVFNVSVCTSYDADRPPPQGTLKTGLCLARWVGLTEDGTRAEKLICEPLDATPSTS